jgi:hypothetical protein
MVFRRIHGFLSTFANVKSFYRRQATKKQLQMVRETQLSIVRYWHRGVRNCKAISKATGIHLFEQSQYNLRLLRNKRKIPVSTKAGRPPKLNAHWSRRLARLLQYHWKERKPLRWYLAKLERRDGPKISYTTLRTRIPLRKVVAAPSPDRATTEGPSQMVH